MLDERVDVAKREVAERWDDVSPPASCQTALGSDAEQRLPIFTSDTERLQAAVGRLAKSDPDLCAAYGLAAWQRHALRGAAVALVLLGASFQTAAGSVVALLLAIPFFFIFALRVAALHWAVTRPANAQALSLLADPEAQETPRYTILVPLFREAQMVPQLLDALGKLEYPHSHLEIFFILEAVDLDTQNAFAARTLPAHMHVLIVPDGMPRTKPRALNYALTYATGTYVTVYDAEDRPQPDQLKLAVANLSSGKDAPVCLQAKLVIDNANLNFFTKQFAIEYSALFGVILPALEKLSLPVPLGGTSNHFDRRVLEKVGAWDAYNVTEDADLGVRLARFGYKVGILEGKTWEEAPQKWRVWLGQRTRWLKGWMQTYIVHMRAPAKLARDLGGRRFAGFQVLMGGLILSALVHPWFYILLMLDASDGSIFDRGEQAVTQGIWWICAANLAAGYVSAILVGMVAVVQSGQRWLAPYALLMPIYWIAISCAAYLAVLELVSAPFYWEKTEHTGAGRDPDVLSVTDIRT